MSIRQNSFSIFARDPNADDDSQSANPHSGLSAGPLLWSSPVAVPVSALSSPSFNAAAPAGPAAALVQSPDSLLKSPSGSILTPEIGTGIKLAYLHVGFVGPSFNLSMQLGLSDGTLAGSTVVDIDTANVGNGGIGSAPDNITAIGSNFIFSATDATHGRELWVSDGTAAGTQLLKDINVTSPTATHDGFNGYNNPSSDQHYQTFATYNGAVYFGANDGTHGTELWKTDGTAAGTTMVSDLVPGATSGFPTWLTVFNNKLYFVVNNRSDGGQIWSYDGTNVAEVTHIPLTAAGLSNSPAAFTLTASGGHLFFDYYDGSNDFSQAQQLWVLDNSATGAHIVKPDTPAMFASPANLADVNGTLYFNMVDGVHGQEMWKSDGTAAGTVMVADIAPGTGGNNAPGSQPYDFVQMGNSIYFVANDQVHGSELWKTDGIVGGSTTMVKDISSPSVAVSNPQGNAFFSGAHLTVIGNTLYFAATDGGGMHGTELWKTDGTEAGTVMVKDIRPGLSGSDPSNFTNINGTLYFEAVDPDTNTQGIWKTDGTDAGTVLVALGTNGGFNPFAFIAPQAAAVAHDDGFFTSETTPIGPGLNVFADNGLGADTGASLAVTAVNGVAASVGQQVTLASGAHLTLNANGNFAYDPNHAFDATPAAASGAANSTATDSFTYTVTGGSTATVTLSIAGEDSNDTLSGTSASDTINGGAGTDTYVFTGASTDYGISYSAATGAYTFSDDRAGHPDGTDSVKNVEHFKFSDGTLDIVLDINGQFISTSFHANDGSSRLNQFDPSDTMPWTQLVTRHDPNGNLISDQTRTDALGLWVNTYDPTNATSSLWDTKHFDPSNNLLEQTVTNDDGTHSLTIYDVANQYGWANATLNYDANWNYVSISGTRDDASHIVTLTEVQPAFDTLLWFASPFDANYNGSPQPLTLTGGTGADTLYGHAGNDSINGSGGNDLIVGGQGYDTLTGGAGDDRFLFRFGDGQDQVTDFSPGNGSNDVIDLHGYGVTNFADLQLLMHISGNDTIITFDDQNIITLQNVAYAQLNAGDFVLS